METFSLVEWVIGGIFVGVNAYRRYNTPTSNRESTTFHSFCTYCFFYLLTVLALYVFIGALLDSSPETIGAIYGLMTGQPSASLPSGLSDLSAPMVSALLITTLLPSLPLLSSFDKALLNAFWDRGHIPYHAQKMATSMRRTHFNFSPRQIKQLRFRCESLQLGYDALELNDGNNLDYCWARVNVLLDGIEEWKQDDAHRLHRFMLDHEDELSELFNLRDTINREYVELRTEQFEDHILVKMHRSLEISIATLFRNSTVFVAKATCIAELSESGRRSRISQLGFEGGTTRFEGLSGRQISSALIAILLTFLALSIVQELNKDSQFQKFSNVAFMTFLMLFTYGTALIITLDLKRRAGMGYNELTQQRSWSAYLTVGIITAFSWLIVSISYRYIIQMLSGVESMDNLQQVLTDIKWSSPYALQSLALAVSLSWILDFHQSRGLSRKLTIQLHSFDIGISMAALGSASIIAYYWMEGLGWFDGYATREETYRIKSPLSMEWIVIKGMAVAAVVGWLVPMWFRLNRSKAPDQIAGRAIMMNKKGLSEEIRNLEPDELIKAVAAVAASIAVIDHDVCRSEKDVYQIICGHLAGLPNSDVDTDGAEKEFDHCLELIESGELQLEARLRNFGRLPLLASLMPFIALSVAFADGVYLDQERAIFEQIRRHVLSPESALG